MGKKKVETSELVVAWVTCPLSNVKQKVEQAKEIIKQSSNYF